MKKRNKACYYSSFFLTGLIVFNRMFMFSPLFEPDKTTIHFKRERIDLKAVHTQRKTKVKWDNSCFLGMTNMRYNNWCLPSISDDCDKDKKIAFRDVLTNRNTSRDIYLWFISDSTHNKKRVKLDFSLSEKKKKQFCYLGIDLFTNQQRVDSLHFTFSYRIYTHLLLSYPL